MDKIAKNSSAKSVDLKPDKAEYQKRFDAAKALAIKTKNDKIAEETRLRREAEEKSIAKTNEKLLKIVDQLLIEMEDGAIKGNTVYKISGLSKEDFHRNTNSYDSDYSYIIKNSFTGKLQKILLDFGLKPVPNNHNGKFWLSIDLT